MVGSELSLDVSCSENSDDEDVENLACAQLSSTSIRKHISLFISVLHYKIFSTMGYTAY